MRKILWCACIVLYALTSQAHNALFSNMTIVEEKNKAWKLYVSSALHAFQFQLAKHYPDKLNGSDSIPQEIFQQLLLDELRKHIHITTGDNKNIFLQNGMVQLGHQTDIRFDIVGLEKDFREIDIANTFFDSIPNHYCIVSLIQKDSTAQTFLLQESNQYRVRLVYDGKLFVEQKQDKFTISFKLIALSLLGLAGIVFAYLSVRKYFFGKGKV